MIWSFSLGKATQPGSDAKPQNHNEDENAEHIGKEIQNVFGARIRDRLFVALARQRVLLGFRRLRRSFSGGGRIGSSRLRRCGTFGIGLHFGSLRLMSSSDE